MSRPTTILIAVAIWIVGMIIALPQLLFNITAEDEVQGSTEQESRDIASLKLLQYQEQMTLQQS